MQGILLVFSWYMCSLEIPSEAKKSATSLYYLVLEVQWHKISLSLLPLFSNSSWKILSCVRELSLILPFVTSMFSSFFLKKSKELCFLCPHIAQPLATLLTGKKKKVLFCSVFTLGPSSGLLFFFITQPSSNTLVPRLGVSLLLWKEA